MTDRPPGHPAPLSWLPLAVLAGLGLVAAALPWLWPGAAAHWAWQALPAGRQGADLTDIAAIVSHRPWAWFTAPLVHLDVQHWAVNLGAYALLTFMTALSPRRGVVAAQVLAGWALPQLILPWTAWTSAMGASGVLHLWLGCLACAWLRHPGRAWSRLGTWTLGLLVLKAVSEAVLAGQGWLPGWVVWPMHAMGLGCALGFHIGHLVNWHGLPAIPFKPVDKGW